MRYSAFLYLAAQIGGVAYNQEDFETICSRGLDLSPTKELLIDEFYLAGKNLRWKSSATEMIIASSFVQ